MQDFNLYFTLGWQHICDWKGYDHILFVMTLCIPYSLLAWRKVLVLVTAFTIGHSITLALSVLDIIHINTSLIEFLIPVTIVFTSLLNITWRKNRTIAAKNSRNDTFNARLTVTYLLTLSFGLIHGLGFSSYLKSLLGTGTNVVPQLFAFNVGLEAGQIIIVLCVMGLSTVFVRFLKAPSRDWILFVSSAIFGIALMMAFSRLSLISF